MSKVYAAKYVDGSTQTFHTWQECELHVKGIAGVIYKGFPTEWEAQSWLDKNVISFIDNTISGLKLYVDGSFISGVKAAGWAFVAVENDIRIHEDFGVVEDKLESRNITGECMAAMQAIAWLTKTGRRAQLIHDYTGISAWLLGDWKRTTKIAETYYVECHRHINLIDFVKIKGHQGNKWNDHVDALAKKALVIFQEEHKCQH